MDLTITSQKKEEYLLIESKGSLKTKDDLLRHSQMIYEEIIKHDFHKILINEPETHFPLELFPYFNLVKEYIDNFPPEIRYLKIAVVVSGEYTQVAESWETLCVSRGLQYFVFTSFKEASNWLLG